MLQILKFEGFVDPYGYGKSCRRAMKMKDYILILFHNREFLF